MVYKVGKMDFYDIIAQGIGIVAMLFNILSYQQKNSRGVIAMQLFGGALFSVSYIMLGVYVGGLLNILAALRGIVYSKREKFKANSRIWIYLFISLFVLSYILTFTVFGKPFTVGAAILELLPVLAMVCVTVSFYVNKAAFIRKMGLISTPCWLIYNICNFTIGAIICDSVSICSIIVGMLRHDIK